MSDLFKEMMQDVRPLKEGNRADLVGQKKNRVAHKVNCR